MFLIKGNDGNYTLKCFYPQGNLRKEVVVLVSAKES
jgi:hypothetical protein